RMPCDDAVGLSPLNAGHHLIEERTSRRLCAERLVIGPDDLDGGIHRKGAQKLASLGFYGKHLAVLGFRGLPTIHEISHMAESWILHRLINSGESRPRYQVWANTVEAEMQ